MLNQQVEFKHHLICEAEINTLFDNLISVLGEEIELYRKLLETLQEEKGILLQPILERIHSINNLKETQVLKARLLEEIRINTMRKISSILGIEESNDIRAIIIHSEEAKGVQLQRRYEILIAILREIRDLNTKNKMLLDASLQSVSASIRFINDMMSSGPTYMETGDMALQNSNGRLLRTEG
jgi:flagellar biosynthesis/type III secretory pathway chaperone